MHIVMFKVKDSYILQMGLFYVVVLAYILWHLSIRGGLLFQWVNTIKNPTKRVGLVQSGPRHHLIEN